MVVLHWDICFHLQLTLTAVNIAGLPFSPAIGLPQNSHNKNLRRPTRSQILRYSCTRMVQPPVFEWYALELVKDGDCFPMRRAPRQGICSGLTQERKPQSDKFPIKETKKLQIPSGKIPRSSFNSRGIQQQSLKALLIHLF